MPRLFLVNLILLLFAPCVYALPSVENLNRIIPHYAAIENGQLEYYRFGNGTPIVLIAGFLTDVTSWDRNFLMTLAQQHQVIVFNNRNVGKSWVNSKEFQASAYANDVYQLLQHLGLKKSTVVGISMGGMIAQELAVLHPEKIDQLILINTALPGSESVRPNCSLQKTLLNMPSTQLGRYLTAVELFFPRAARLQMAYAIAMNRFIPAQYTEIDVKKVIAEQRCMILNWAKDNATAKKIARLNLPVLILNGGADQVIPPINSVILANKIRHAKLLRWQEGGHAMIFQYPLNIANAINDFTR